MEFFAIYSQTIIIEDRFTEKISHRPSKGRLLKIKAPIIGRMQNDPEDIISTTGSLCTHL